MADFDSGHYTSFEHIVGGLGLYEKWRNLRYTAKPRREQKPRQEENARPRRTARDQALKVLGLEPGATQKEIRSRYRTLARQHHPDAPNGDVERMKAINAAYAALEVK